MERELFMFRKSFLLLVTAIPFATGYAFGMEDNGLDRSTIKIGRPRGGEKTWNQLLCEFLGKGDMSTSSSRSDSKRPFIKHCAEKREKLEQKRQRTNNPEELKKIDRKIVGINEREKALSKLGRYCTVEEAAESLRILASAEPKSYGGGHLEWLMSLHRK
jgi:hypothetical protein